MRIYDLNIYFKYYTYTNMTTTTQPHTTQSTERQRQSEVNQYVFTNTNI